MDKRITIITGGQTGVDTAALDVACLLNIPYMGLIPNDGNEIFSAKQLKKRYPNLEISETDNHDVRTAINILTGDAALTFSPTKANSPGTKFGLDIINQMSIPSYTITNFSESEIKKVKKWLDGFDKNIIKLSIGGPRASEWSEGYAKVKKFLYELLK